MFNILRKKAENGIVTRILIGTDNPINKREVEWLSEYPRIELCYLIKSIKTRLTTIVTDRELSLVIEEKENDDNIDDLGLEILTQIVSQQSYHVLLFSRTYGHNQLVTIEE
jgi:hypothetical protein